jgi:hypothetical protein
MADHDLAKVTARVHPGESSLGILEVEGTVNDRLDPVSVNEGIHVFEVLA